MRRYNWNRKKVVQRSESLSAEGIPLLGGGVVSSARRRQKR
jgi:hypothetical protein